MHVTVTSVRLTRAFLRSLLFEAVATPPTLTTATIPAAGTTTVLVFNEAVTAVPADDLGFTLDSTGAAVTLAYAGGKGTATVTMTNSRTVLDAETLTLDYAGAAVVDVERGAPLRPITDRAVVNDSTQI